MSSEARSDSRYAQSIAKVEQPLWAGGRIEGRIELGVANLRMAEAGVRDAELTALTQVGTAWVRIANLAILFVFLSLGLNIVVGFAGLLDLGYIAFYAVGAYVYALLASPHFNLHLPFWIILPLGAALHVQAQRIKGPPAAAASLARAISSGGRLSVRYSVISGSKLTPAGTAARMRCL